jgi:hypothetical protein
MTSVSGVEDAGRIPRWTDSTIKGRDEILAELHELAVTPPKLVVLEGPRGAGTSTLAGEFVRQARVALRERAREDPVMIHVDISSLDHAKGDPSRGVAAAILHRFQHDLSLAGASTGRVVWWALRRIAAQSSPVVLWLDQVHQETRTLAGVLEPLLEPERFLEQGAHLPPLLVVVSGTGHANLGSWAGNILTKWIHVPHLPREVLEEVVVSRARALGFEISDGAVAKVLSIMVTSGRGLSIMDEILKTSAAQAGTRLGRTVTERDVPTPRISVRNKASRQALEVRVLEIIRAAGGEMTMGELAEQVTRDLTRKGEAHRTASTLRRLTVRLEKLELVERHVSIGGDGGTQSVVRALGRSTVHPSLPR